MAERPEQHERTPNEPAQHLTFAEVGERLGATPDAVRTRVSRGKLASIVVDGKRLVVWSQPDAAEQPKAQRTERTEQARSAVQEERRFAALEDRIESVEGQLVERTEEIRRRDHIIAGFIERLPETLELPASVAPQEGSTEPQEPQDTSKSRAIPPNHLHPTEITLGRRVRRWLRG